MSCASRPTPIGVNRELASEYHGLVLELALAAAAELALAGRPVPPALGEVIVRVTDALAAVVDSHLEPPRQGDGDDGYGLLLDDPDATAGVRCSPRARPSSAPRPWWPSVPPPDVTAAAFASARPASSSPDRRTGPTTAPRSSPNRA